MGESDVSSATMRLFRKVMCIEVPQEKGTSFPWWQPCRPMIESELGKAASDLGVADGESEYDPVFEALEALIDSITKLHPRDRYRSSYKKPLESIKSGQFTRSVGAEQLKVWFLGVAEVSRWLQHPTQKPGASQNFNILNCVVALLGVLAAKQPVLTDDELRRVIGILASVSESHTYLTKDSSLAAIGQLLAHRTTSITLDEPFRSDLQTLFDCVAHEYPTDSTTWRHRRLLRSVLNGGVAPPVFEPIDPWSTRLKERAEALSPADQSTLIEIADLALACNVSRPGKDWVAKMTRLLARMNRADLTDLLMLVVSSAPDPENEFLAASAGNEVERKKARVIETHHRTHEALRGGLIIAAGLLNDDRLTATLADAVEKAGRLPMSDRFAALPMASTMVRAIALAPGGNLSTLQRLNYRVKWPAARKVLAKALASSVARSGMTPIDAEELTIPDFGLVLGKRRLPIGELAVEIEVVNSVKPTIRWQKADGTPAKSSAAHKKEDPEGVAAAVQTAKDIESLLPAQRTRLEMLMRDVRTWRYDQWCQRYRDHGLVAPLARRLIWTVDGTPLIHPGGAALDVEGRTVQPKDSAEVRLWHPIGRGVDEVLAWRGRLETLGITQPFKQAHREVYLLTDAEINTGVYSNRFAAHIVKAPALLAIGQVRRWKVSLYGMATLDLPQFELRSEFWSSAAGEEHNDLGGPKYLSTDQVRFYRTGATDPLPLREIPVLAFTEVLRDVDMFVGVCSVANDPNWADGGPQGRYRDYWHSYSFGELSASAATRREVLQRLLPRLTKLAGKWQLSDRFLLIRGNIRTYKIHLGSTNILMEPNDQYLCIVPDSRREPAPGYLPFEGDTQLSVILSKALLPVDDEQIADPTITRQIALK